MASIIEQYMQEIQDMQRSLESSKYELEYAIEQKRIHRPTSRGRIANDNWNARLGNATYDVRIAAIRAKIAMLKNQIALRKEAIKEEKAKLKTAKSSKPAAKKTISKPTTKTATKSSAAKSTVKTNNKKSTSTKKAATPAKKAVSTIKKNADGGVDKRTKEGKKIAERMAKARAARTKNSKKK